MDDKASLVREHLSTSVGQATRESSGVDPCLDRRCKQTGKRLTATARAPVTQPARTQPA